ncbi:MAG TPA: creatininase family protein [Minicystis sp.]|nr:creatininase family protein [Minicystis sp.]
MTHGTMRGALLEDMTWMEAEKRLGPETVVVLPIGAAAKEHGPHLLLKNDLLLADHFKMRVAAEADVVIAPTIGYHFYPAFREYPGSITLRLETARDLVIDTCASLAAFGPRRFYALNTGISTVRALAPAAASLRARGVLLHYTDVKTLLGPIERDVAEQEGGSHADEIETSMMLVIAPETVDMAKAVKDYDASGRPGLSRKKDGPSCYSPTGTWGDPTLATRAKGEKVIAAYLAGILRDVEALRAAPLPPAPPP